MADQNDKAKELEEQLKGMGKKVNPKVVPMLERCVLRKGSSGLED